MKGVLTFVLILDFIWLLYWVYEYYRQKQENRVNKYKQDGYKIIPLSTVGNWEALSPGMKIDIDDQTLEVIRMDYSNGQMVVKIIPHDVRQVSRKG